MNMDDAVRAFLTQWNNWDSEPFAQAIFTFRGGGPLGVDATSFLRGPLTPIPERHPERAGVILAEITATAMRAGINMRNVIGVGLTIEGHFRAISDRPEDREARRLARQRRLYAAKGAEECMSVYHRLVEPGSPTEMWVKLRPTGAIIGPGDEPDNPVTKVTGDFVTALDGFIRVIQQARTGVSPLGNTGVFNPNMN